MSTSVCLKLPQWTVKAISIWKAEMELELSNQESYRAILMDFAECYLKDKGMSDESFERFRNDYYD